MPASPPSSILADDMGLGKTLQTIALILSNLPKDQDDARCNLIVAPLSVLASWRIQLEQFVQPGRLNVADFRGNNRESTLRMVKRDKIDILLVSYETLASEFKQHQEMLQEQAEEAALAARQKTSKKAKKRKIVNIWKTTKGSDDESDFDPENMDDNEEEDDDAHDLPLAMTRKRKHCRNLWIFDVPLHRIILDEAHSIRNSKTGRFKAVKALMGKHKLALSGTPYINRPSDLHALFSFLEADPLAELSVFDEFITRPIANFRELGLSRVRTMMSHLALRRTKAVVKSTIQLPPKDLEVRFVEFEKEEGFHFMVHDVLYKTVRAAYISMLGNRDARFGHMMHFMALVNRVRQSCCHGGLVPVEAREMAEEVLRELEDNNMTDNHGAFDLDSYEGKALLQKILSCLSSASEEHYTECAVCFEALVDDSACVLRSCKHVLCGDCLNKIETRGSGNCPLCRAPYRKRDIIKKSVAEAAAKKIEKEQPKPVATDATDEMHPKEAAVLDEISKMAPGERAVIFSTWTSVLDIMQGMLNKHGYVCTRLDGSMSPEQRLEAIQNFDSEKAGAPSIILCSLLACGTGINLTRGSLAIIIEPWWNNSMEAQALDRIYRIGQTRPVRCVRLILKNSIEERMKNKVQDSKAALGKGSLQKLSRQEREKARITAMRDLFEIDNSIREWEGDFEDDFFLGDYED